MFRRSIREFVERSSILRRVRHVKGMLSIYVAIEGSCDGQPAFSGTDWEKLASTSAGYLALKSVQELRVRVSLHKSAKAKAGYSHSRLLHPIVDLRCKMPGNLCKRLWCKGLNVPYARPSCHILE
jgi:hypothetical protein